MTRRDTGPDARTREIVRQRSERFGYPRCEACGFPGVDHIHHRRPRGIGGSRLPDTNDPGNLLALCAVCHASIESDRERAYSFGWLVRQGVKPADMPAFIHDLGMAWLSDTYLPSSTLITEITDLEEP